VLVAIGAAAVVVWRLRAVAPEPVAAATTSVGAATAQRAKFVLRLDSLPSGAAVTEREVVVGHTPLELELERASFDAGPRTFVLTRDGFVPVTHVQADSSNDVQATLTLAPRTEEPPAPRLSRRRHQGDHREDAPSPSASARASAAAPPPRAQDRLDINLAR
jgi:hypothetical protein